MDIFKQALGGLSGGRVLDVATGGGRFVQRLIDHLQDYDTITGIDPSDEVLDDEESIFHQPNIRFVKMDAEQLDFPDASFDTVSMSGALHHLEHLDRVLDEINRVLRPGGHCILQEAYQDGQTEAQLTSIYLHHWYGGIDTETGPYYHGEMFTRQQIIDTAERLGLHDLALFDMADLSDDPLDILQLDWMDDFIDRVIEMNQARPDAESIRERGEALRQRMHAVGYHPPSRLLVVGQKPG